MSKSKWWKNKETGEVVLQTGSNRQNMGTVFYRVRSGETFSETKSKFFSSHAQIEASGFPAERVKEFKRRYAVYDRWSQGEAFVVEFEPGKFKVVMKDGREIFRDEATCKHFAEFFRDGWWKLVSEAEALSLLDKPKPPVPAAEQFGTGPWYGAGLKYIYGPVGFYVYKNGSTIGWVAYEVVQNLWNLGMISKERPKSAIEQVSAILDVPKTAFKPKKVLVEWAIRLKATPNEAYYTRLFPEGASPAVARQKCFKTGRTVEVPE